jgi:hypothetical protein
LWSFSIDVRGRCQAEEARRAGVLCANSWGRGRSARDRSPGGPGRSRSAAFLPPLARRAPSLPRPGRPLVAL